MKRFKNRIKKLEQNLRNIGNEEKINDFFKEIADLMRKADCSNDYDQEQYETDFKEILEKYERI